MSDMSEQLAREIRTELAEYNDQNQPVILLVRAVVESARAHDAAKRAFLLGIINRGKS